MPPAASPESTDFLQQLQPGQRLAGCYLLLKQITGTPERTIWLANDEVLGKDVALHFLPPEFAGNADVAARLKDAVKRNRPLIHPHVLRTYDFIEEEDWSAISTDAFEGPTLADRLQDGALEVGGIRPWVEQICKTLEDAHRIRVAHGGLTPNDISVDSRGEVRLMNFGISAVIRDALRSSRSGANLSALSYASPEQLAGGKPGVADDIFALGVVVHELLAGEPPFQGAEREAAPTSIAAHRETLGHRGDPIPASWEKAVAGALTTDPASRLTSASQWWKVASSPITAEEEGAVSMVEPRASESEPPSPSQASDALAAVAPVSKAVTDVETREKVAEENAPPETTPIDEPQHRESEAAASSDQRAPVEVQRAEQAESSADPARSAPEAAPEAAPPEQVKERAKHELTAASDEAARKPELRSKRRISQRVTPAEGKARTVAAVPPEELAERIRREEAEAEARELGYDRGEDEGYRRTGRSVGRARMALPIIGAAVGLLALFGLIKLLVGSPDVASSRSGATTATTNPSTSTPVDSTPKTVTPERSNDGARPSDSSDSPKMGNLAEATNSRLDASAEKPATKVGSESLEANTTPAPTAAKNEPEPAKTAAQEHEAALQRVQELETKLTSTKNEIAEKTKALPQILKSADEMAAQQKKRDDAAKKTEQAAQQAEQAATEKRRLADEAKKAATDLAEQIKTRREEHGKTQEEVTTLRSSLAEDEKALAEANEAVASAAKRLEAETAKPAPAEQASAVVSGAPAAEREDSEAAKARNDERKRIDEEMAALRRKLAEQAQKLGATLDATRTAEASAAPAKEPDLMPLPSRTETANPLPLPLPSPDLALNKAESPRIAEPTPSAGLATAKVPKADANRQFMNSLGMKFLPVAGAEPIFCIWPTRVRDFEAFARSTGLKSTLWKDPGFKQGPDHPVVNVTWQEAVAFCKWLTIKDQKEGLIGADQAYRLPTDLEWSVAVGLSNEPGRTPEERDMSVPDVYPWGTVWPPPGGAGNYTGEETGSDVAIKGYDDGFPWTSPVGSFPANKFGLFDMGGNVWEWCMDTWNNGSKARVLRGASWYNGALKLSLLSSCRVHASPDSGTDNYGFRVVIAGEAGKSKR